MLLSYISSGQNINVDYELAFIELENNLSDKRSSFKRTVFVVENTYLEGKLDYQTFEDALRNQTILCQKFIEVNPLDYEGKDKRKIELMGAIFKIMKDTIKAQITNDTLPHLLFSYDFEDVFGDKDWTNMFVSKLLATGKGNCHSLPYLYKILAEELGYGQEAHLALAPNHTYIKINSESMGWFNTELTSGYFPTDAWLMASGYIHLDAIVNQIYMEALNEKQSIALCVMDLAEGYLKKIPEPDLDFILDCCELTLTYYPNCIKALLLKAETLKKQFRALNQFPKDQESSVEVIEDTDLVALKAKLKKMFAEMEQLYIQIHRLGYRSMPKHMYLDWLPSIAEEQGKYLNQKLPQKKIKYKK